MATALLDMFQKQQPDVLVADVMSWVRAQMSWVHANRSW